MKHWQKVISLTLTLLMLCLLMAGCEQPEQKTAYMAAIDNYYAAIVENDFAKMEKAMPAQALDALGMNAADLSGTNTRYAGRYGSDFTVKVKEKGGRQLNEKQSKDLATYLRGDYGISAALKDAYLVEFTLTISGSEDKQTHTEGYVVYQLGDTWYMDLWADANVPSIRSMYDET